MACFNETNSLPCDDFFELDLSFVSNRIEYMNSWDFGLFQMSEDNIEIGICNADGFRRLTPQEVKDYLANIA